MNSVHITDAMLREKLSGEFGSKGGGAHLAKALGVSPSTASLLLSGSAKASLIKVAAYHKLEAAGTDAWVTSAPPRHPQDVGYKPAPGQASPTSDVAKRIGVSQFTLRGVMAKAHIRLRQEGLRRICALTNLIEARTEFATQALTSLDDDELDEEGHEDEVVEELRPTPRRVSRPSASRPYHRG